MRIKMPGSDTVIHTGFKKTGRAKDNARATPDNPPARERHNIIPGLSCLPFHKSRPARPAAEAGTAGAEATGENEAPAKSKTLGPRSASLKLPQAEVRTAFDDFVEGKVGIDDWFSDPGQGAKGKQTPEGLYRHLMDTVAAPGSSRNPKDISHELLGVPQDADRETIEKAYDQACELLDQLPSIAHSKQALPIVTGAYRQMLGHIAEREAPPVGTSVKAANKKFDASSVATVPTPTASQTSLIDPAVMAEVESRSHLFHPEAKFTKRDGTTLRSVYSLPIDEAAKILSQDPVLEFKMTDETVLYRSTKRKYISDDSRITGNAASKASIRNHLAVEKGQTWRYLEREAERLKDIDPKNHAECLRIMENNRIWAPVKMQSSDLPDASLNVMLGEHARNAAQGYGGPDAVLVEMKLGDFRKAGGGVVFRDDTSAFAGREAMPLIVTLPKGKTIPAKIVEHVSESGDANAAGLVSAPASGNGSSEDQGFLPP